MKLLSRLSKFSAVALMLSWLVPVGARAQQASAPAQSAVPAPVAASSPAVRANAAIVGAPQSLSDGFPQSAIDNYNTRHERYSARAKQGGVDVLFVGDSIMQGWGGAAGKPIWDTYYGAMHAENFGVGWDRTQHLLWRLQNGEGQGLSPKVVVLLIGTNNIGANTNEEAAAGVGAVVEELKKDFRDAKILLLGVFPRGAPGSAPRRSVAAVNETVSKLDDGRKVTYLDIGSVFMDADGVISREVMADLLHPTAKGYQLWADAMKAPLAKLMN